MIKRLNFFDIMVIAMLVFAILVASNVIHPSLNGVAVGLYLLWAFWMIDKSSEERARKRHEHD